MSLTDDKSLIVPPVPSDSPIVERSSKFSNTVTEVSKEDADLTRLKEKHKLWWTTGLGIVGCTLFLCLADKALLLEISKLIIAGLVGYCLKGKE